MQHTALRTLIEEVALEKLLADVEVGVVLIIGISLLEVLEKCAAVDNGLSME